MRRALHLTLGIVTAMASACRQQTPLVPGDTLCEIDGVQYNEGAIELTAQASCCRPDLSKTSWSPWFQERVSYHSTILSSSIAAADLQGNGLLDLIELSPVSLAIHRQLGGDAGFANLGDEDFIGNVVLMADVSGDKYPDAVTMITGPCVINSDCTIGVAVMLGDPTTEDLTPQVYYLAGQHAVSGVIADFDRDGLPDVAVGLEAGVDAGCGALPGGCVRILWNQGAGVFTEDSRFFPVGTLPASLAVANLDGDDWPDLIVADTVEQHIDVLRNQHSRDGGFVAEPRLTSGHTPWAVATGDFHHPGVLELASANGDGTVSLWRDDGGVFGSPAVIPVGGSPYALATADFDGDGNTDLAVLSFNDGTITVLRPSLTVAPIQVFLPPNHISANSIVAADFNQDGHIDLAATDHNTGSLHVFMANCGGPPKTSQ
jgi:hypothetical protein